MNWNASSFHKMSRQVSERRKTTWRVCINCSHEIFSKICFVLFLVCWTHHIGNIVGTWIILEEVLCICWSWYLGCSKSAWKFFPLRNSWWNINLCPTSTPVECPTNSFADLDTLRNFGVDSMETGSILRYVELHQKCSIWKIVLNYRA